MEQPESLNENVDQDIKMIVDYTKNLQVDNGIVNDPTSVLFNLLETVKSTTKNDSDAEILKTTVLDDENKGSTGIEKDKLEERDSRVVTTEKDENGFVFYKCRFCGLTFNFLTTLKAHERVHNVVQPYLCNKCGESFHFMCELEYHAKSHLKQKGYKCDCGRTFYQYTDLLYHSHPGEDDNIVLPLPSLPLQHNESQRRAINSAKFPVPEYMEKGFEPKHPLKIYSEIRSKPYICQYCSKSYADSRGLTYHMYSHRGEKIFNPRASRYLMCRNDF